MTLSARETLLDIIKNLRLHLSREMQAGQTLMGFYHPPAPRTGKSVSKPSLAPDRPEFLELSQAVKACQKCGLAKTRRQVVFGEGAPNPRLVLVGEAPGAEEDKQGRIFVGAAGELLTRMLEAIGLSRAEVFICNVLKCRTPGNRNPSEEEITACSPFLRQQLLSLRPELICALGTFAAQTLLQTQESMGQLRGKKHAFEGVPLIVTYHPAALLYHPQNKRLAWEDMKNIAAHLGLSKPAPAVKHPQG